MNSKQLEYFIDLSQTLNFTKTAQNFYLSQTAITKQIQALEKDLGITLFTRTKKSVILTKAGQFYLPYAKEIVKQIRLSYQIVEQYKNGLQGDLYIGFIKSLDQELLLHFLQTIKMKCPNSHIHYQAYTRNELFECFNQRKLDLIVTFDYPRIQNYPHILLKKSHLRKYYHQDCSLENLPLIYDVQKEYLDQSELEQTLLKLCLKEGYAILHDFVELHPYASYLTFQETTLLSPISFYYHKDHQNSVLEQILTLYKNKADD